MRHDVLVPHQRLGHGEERGSLAAIALHQLLTLHRDGHAGRQHAVQVLHDAHCEESRKPLPAREAGLVESDAVLPHAEDNLLPADDRHRGERNPERVRPEDPDGIDAAESPPEAGERSGGRTKNLNNLAEVRVVGKRHELERHWASHTRHPPRQHERGRRARETRTSRRPRTRTGGRSDLSRSVDPKHLRRPRTPHRGRRRVSLRRGVRLSYLLLGPRFVAARRRMVLARGRGLCLRCEKWNRPCQLTSRLVRRRRAQQLRANVSP